MLYESEFFSYLFSSSGEFLLQAMNIPNVNLKITVIESNENSFLSKSISKSNIDLSFMSSHSLNYSIEESAFLKTQDHKMNRNRGIEYFNFLEQGANQRSQFCDYFGEKSTLIRKYQILGKIFNSSKEKGKNKFEQNKPRRVNQRIVNSDENKENAFSIEEEKFVKEIKTENDNGMISINSMLKNVYLTNPNTVESKQPETKEPECDTNELILMFRQRCN